MTNPLGGVLNPLKKAAASPLNNLRAFNNCSESVEETYRMLLEIFLTPANIKRIALEKHAENHLFVC